MFPSVRGFALAEVLVAIFVLGVSTVAITGLSMLGSRSSLEAGRQTVAIGLVNRQIEQIRGSSYGSVGFVQPAANEPDGILTHEQKITQGQQSYILHTTVKLVDDPANGTVNGVLTENNADYKEVKIEATWTAAGGTARDVSTTTYVANAAVACTPGALSVCQPPGNTPEGTECTPGSTCAGGAACLDSGLCGPTPTPSPLPQCADCTGGVCPSPTITFAPSVSPSPSPTTLLDCPASGLCPTNAASPTPTPSPTCPPGVLYCDPPGGSSPTPTPSATPDVSCGEYCSCAAGQVCDADSSTCCDPTKDPNCTPPPPKCPTGQIWDEATQSCKNNDCSVTGCPTCQSCNTTSGMCDTDPNCTPPVCDANTPPEVCPYGQAWDSATCLCKDNTCTTTGCPACQTCNATSGQCDTDPNCTPPPPCDPAVDPTCQTDCPQCQIYNATTGLCDADPSCDSCGTIGCPGGQVCNPGSGQCGDCNNNSQCPLGEVCTDGSCHQDCNTSGLDCAGNEVCNPTTGDCGPPIDCSGGTVCPEGLVCNGGICEGPECGPPPISVDCSLLGPIDPGCSCPIGGRWVVNSWTPVEGGNIDPYCSANYTAYCAPNTTWATCSCPTPTPGVCGDGTCNYGQETVCGGAGTYYDCPIPAGTTQCVEDCAVCGDGYCTNLGPINETANCPEDCSVCGDGVCTYPPETATSCPDDCNQCPDGVCNPNETSVTCPQDCSPPPLCASGETECNVDYWSGGDGCCSNTSETCTTRYCELNCASGGTYCATGSCYGDPTTGVRSCVSCNPSCTGGQFCATGNVCQCPTGQSFVNGACTADCGGTTDGYCASPQVCAYHLEPSYPYYSYQCELPCGGWTQGYCPQPQQCVGPQGNLSCQNPCGSATGGTYCTDSDYVCLNGNCNTLRCESGGSYCQTGTCIYNVCDPGCGNGGTYCSNGYQCVAGQCTCGNGFCDGGEDINSCAGDCTNTPSPTPTPGWCWTNADCPYPLYNCTWAGYCEYTCGNGTCEPGFGEDSLNCQADCSPCSINLDQATCQAYNCYWNSSAPKPYCS